MKIQGITIHKNTKCKTWYTRYRINGKQFYISAKTQKDCYNKLKQKLNIIKKEKEKKTYTLETWFNKWLELYKADRKKNTIADYKKSFKYFEHIKNKNLEKITTIQILELLNSIKFERRKQMVFELLNSLYKKAIASNIINKNPLENIDKPKHKKQNGEVISSEDEEEFIKILEEKGKDVFLITLYQGFRRGEVLALTIEDINFKERTININKAINQYNEYDTTKTEYSVRTVPMFEKTYNILKKYKNEEGRLFNYTYNGIASAFKKIKDKYFPNTKYTIKSLRHTFITKCREKGIPLHIIQKWVGHIKGSEVTDKVYTHPRTEKENECINIINNIDKE